MAALNTDAVCRIVEAFGFDDWRPLTLPEIRALHHAMPTRGRVEAAFVVAWKHLGSTPDSNTIVRLLPVSVAGLAHVATFAIGAGVNQSDLPLGVTLPGYFGGVMPHLAAQPRRRARATKEVATA